MAIWKKLVMFFGLRPDARKRFVPTEPIVSKVPGSDWWLCKNNITHGYGHTPEEAHFQWFAWLKLGIYDSPKKYPNERRKSG